MTSISTHTNPGTLVTITRAGSKSFINVALSDFASGFSIDRVCDTAFELQTEIEMVSEIVRGNRDD